MAAKANTADSATQALDVFMRQNGNLIPLPLGANTAALKAIDAKATAAQEKAEAALPKSGGEMTGSISLKSKTYDVSNAPDASEFSPGVAFFDKNGINIGSVQCRHDPDGTRNISMFLPPVLSGEEWYAALTVLRNPENNQMYCSFPNPRGLYSNDGVTFQSMVDYAPQKTTAQKNIHVNANTGSDTADLYNGRGLSEDMPFKTPLAALAYADSNIVGMYDVNIILHSDCSCALPQRFLNSRLLNIMSDGTKRKLTLTDNIWMLQGAVRFSNLSIAMQSYFMTAKDQNFSRFAFVGVDFTGTAMKICANGGVVDFEGSCTFNGTASADGLITADIGGKASLWNGASLSGSVAGKRYAAKNGSSILVQGKGPNAIPGSEAGSCDATSVYA